MRKLVFGLLLAAAAGLVAMTVFNDDGPLDQGWRGNEREPDTGAAGGSTGSASVAAAAVAEKAEDVERAQLPWVTAASCVDQGKVREYNEDRLVVQASPEQRGLLVAVADGMGGHQGGAVAAQIVVDALRAAARATTADSEQAAYEMLLETLLGANEAVRAKGAESIGGRDMGATCVAAWLMPGKFVHLYAGDSRLYQFRGGDLVYRTRDHSMVQVLVESGSITEAEARVHPMRSRLTTCIGGGRERVDAEPRWNLEGGEQPAVLETQPGDVLLLCSDGLHGEVDEAEIAGLVKEHGGDPERLARACVSAALEAGGGDNVAVIAVRVGEAMA